MLEPRDREKIRHATQLGGALGSKVVAASNACYGIFWGLALTDMPGTNDLLKGVAIFKDLDDSEIGEIAAICKEEKFNSGEYIFKEGEAGNRLYLIVEGDVRISRDVPGSGEEALAVLKPGALFGEMSVFDRS